MGDPGGKFLDINEILLDYTLDTTKGQSGSPVYVWHNSYGQAIIKIAKGARRNSSTGSGEVKARFSLDQYTDLTFIPLESTSQGIIKPKGQVKYAIVSFKFPNTYLYMDGN
ncbi:uncharacterized protein K444DRAFT_636480 [Hyaloscypha bicolor E]|uniref:Uncharacterized protein n=1 Tax=Hyaloscypha bicolor E TaxID=1095630 RepID=A0A2J6SK29_9HELO|nr:uncharacterized protein K444DRAFT_636480 [Hyaloscypha bicolor E]PMD51131.1 hypothetical protein K444DRAFT_636480 [Hyaloscypha bicolor E]